MGAGAGHHGADGMLAAVTGATGFVGRRLVAHLAEQRPVRAVVRAPGAFPAGVEVAVADVTDPVAVAAALSGASVVFHLAARLHVTDPAPGMRDEYEAVNVRGTRHVLQAAGPARVVVFSTVAVYGPGDRGAPFTERSPLRPATAYAETKAEAEGEAAGHPDAVVLRPAAVYGPGMKGNYLRMLRAIERRRFAYVGDGANRRTLVHVDDLCRAAVAAASDAPPGTCFNVTDGSIHTLREVGAAMAGALGHRPPRVRLPAAPLRVALAGAARLAGRRLPVGPDAVDKLMEDVAVDGTLLAAATSYEPRVGLAEGWASVVAERQRVTRRTSSQ